MWSDSVKIKCPSNYVYSLTFPILSFLPSFLFNRLPFQLGIRSWEAQICVKDQTITSLICSS